MIKITKNWANLLKDEFSKPYFKQLQEFLEHEYSTKTIYPEMGIFSTPLMQQNMKMLKL